MALTAKDKIFLKHSDSDIFNAISHFDTYPKWWPSIIAFKDVVPSEEIVNATVFVKPFLSPGFGWQISNIIPNRVVEITYTHGAYTGKGTWEIFPTDEGCELVYEVELNIENAMIQMASNFINISSIHSKLMTMVFKKLDRYLLRP